MLKFQRFHQLSKLGKVKIKILLGALNPYFPVSVILLLSRNVVRFHTADKQESDSEPLPTRSGGAVKIQEVTRLGGSTRGLNISKV